ncbi:transposable element Tcb2 transposase [Trichonephila clavipes]|nr:transposable element Tcb2 transposase [Trichonephila clavipes]
MEKADAANVSMCLVVLFSDFGINTNPKILFQKTCSRPTTSYNTCRRPFSSSFGTKEKNHYCAAARCRPLSSIRKKNLRYYGAKSSFCMQKPVCAFPSTDERNRLCWAREHVSWTQQQWASVLFTERVRFTMESDSTDLEGTAH